MVLVMVLMPMGDGNCDDNDGDGGGDGDGACDGDDGCVETNVRRFCQTVLLSDVARLCPLVCFLLSGNLARTTILFQTIRPCARLPDIVDHVWRACARPNLCEQRVIAHVRMPENHGAKSTTITNATPCQLKPSKRMFVSTQPSSPSSPTSSSSSWARRPTHPPTQTRAHTLAHTHAHHPITKMSCAQTSPQKVPPGPSGPYGQLGITSGKSRGGGVSGGSVMLMMVNMTMRKMAMVVAMVMVMLVMVMAAMTTCDER